MQPSGCEPENLQCMNGIVYGSVVQPTFLQHLHLAYIQAPSMRLQAGFLVQPLREEKHLS